MRKQMAFILTLCLVALTFSVAAAAAPTYSVVKAPAGMQIDGKIDEQWLDAQVIPVFVNDPVVKAYGTLWDTVRSATVARFMWDEDNAYLAFVVNDAEINLDGAMFYQKDAVSAFFSNEKGLNGKVFVSPAKDGASPIASLGILGGEAYANAKVKVGAAVTAQGYNVEFAVPWSEIGVASVSAGDQLAFTVLLIDSNEDSWGQVMWVGAGDDPNGYVTATLKP